MSSSCKNKKLDSSQIEIIYHLLENMKYGSITLIVQDGRIIQIDKTEKHRINN